jgi:hypothetical protein
MELGAPGTIKASLDFSLTHGQGLFSPYVGCGR